MTSAQGIQKLGFRRWYERQLIEGHAYLVTCILSMIVVAASFEGIQWRGPWPRLLLMLSLVVAGAWLAIASLRRYNFLLFRAECLGAQSSCPHCGVYGLLQVVAAGSGETPQPGVIQRDDNPWLRVRCKKCSHEWLMENA